MMIIIIIIMFIFVEFTDFIVGSKFVSMSMCVILSCTVKSKSK